MEAMKKTNSKKEVKPLVPDIYHKIQLEILSGKLSDGDWIVEQRICQDYNVSRTPVREALRQLETDGLAKKIPNRGYFVVGISDTAAEDMLQLRKIYEVQAVKWAIERITPLERRKLSKIFGYMKYYTEKNDIGRLLNVNVAFHNVIHKASKNTMLMQNLKTIERYLVFLRPSKIYSDDYIERVFAEHEEIYHAILAGDIKNGAAAMEKHMSNSIIRKSI
ncbi:DNA-binding transcriptional regulator, GntR family [Peptostreptococcaceae bacterium pGA-8]|nr:DNA-binding transcriptional regulator, GntR family [Peptostreptococcaceae bacterium pGA-8]